MGPRRPRLVGGGSGIRTHGGPKTTTAFEAAPFVRSGIPPSDDATGEARAACPGRTRARTSAHASARTPGGDRELVVEAGVDAEVVERATGAGLGIGGAEDDPGHPGGEERPGAHGARLEGDHDGGAGQPPPAGGGGGPAQGEHLGVGGGVAGPLPLVAGPGQHLAVGIEHDARRRARRRPLRPPRPRPGRGPWPRRRSRRILTRQRAIPGRGRREWDSNQRVGRRTHTSGGSGIRTHGGQDPHTLSKRADSAALASLPGADQGTLGPVGPVPALDVVAGPCATAPREPSQGRKAAALSGSSGVPQVAWPSRRAPVPGAVLGSGRWTALWREKRPEPARRAAGARSVASEAWPTSRSTAGTGPAASPS